MMEPGDDNDDAISAAMLSSWFIISELGQTLTHKHPMITDLQKLCKAAGQCTHNIHKQLIPLFRSCNLPFPTHQEPHEFVLIYNLSPVNEFLKTLQLLDPKDDTSESPVIDDYQPLSQSPCIKKAYSPRQMRACSPAPACTALVLLKAKKNASVSQSSQASTAVTCSTTEQTSTIKQLLSSALSYPLHPFVRVFKYVKKQTPYAEPIWPVRVAHETIDTKLPLDRQEEDQSMINNGKYQRVLTHGKKLLKEVTTGDAEALKLLEQLKIQLISLQEGITANIERIEADRASFNILQQCVCVPHMSLSDMLLLQYCKMGAHNASLENAVTDFFHLKCKLTDITQEQFETRWKTIQELHRTEEMDDTLFDQMRQYSYILQNATSRHIAQAFLDGTINNYGMTQTIAYERGLTPECITQLTSELSNCKDFLQQLNRAFKDSLKNIEAAMNG